MTKQETPRTASTSEVVSQSEIENLLAMVGGEGADLTALGNQDNSESAHVHRYEFPSASSLTTIELRKLRVRHEEFIQTLASRLSLHFRLEVNLQMLRLDTVPFRQFVDGLNNPTHIDIFKLEPFRGVCLLDIPLRLAMCIIDRELGGTARASDDARELSKMEERLLHRVVEVIIGEWCAAWASTMELRPVLLRTENNGRFVQGHQPHTSMLVLGLEARIGLLVEQMQFAFPCNALEPILIKLNQEAEMLDDNEEAKRVVPTHWNPEFNEMGLRISADLPDLELSARELGDLKPGDVIPFNADLAKKIQIYLEASPKFVGTLGVSGKQLAVQISQNIKT